MWDDDFSKKKNFLGRIIERDKVDEISKGISNIKINKQNKKTKEEQDKHNYDRGRIIRTTNIDMFLNEMDGKQLSNDIEEEQTDIEANGSSTFIVKEDVVTEEEDE